MDLRSPPFPNRASATLIMVALMSLVFFAGCENTKPKNQADRNGILKEPDKGREVHGEVGAMYGHSG